MTSTAPIRRLLVANRGEIARRIFATCRSMGISTVAVYSDADRHTPFVSDADRGIALGGSAPSESYLRTDALVDAALRSGADAVHPGYGFLAENAGFARAVTAAGLTWVGPPPEAIEMMGSKVTAKRLMEEAGVPTLASVELADLDATAIHAAATDLGYPVLVKASAGGGGKGMHAVFEPDQLEAAVDGARRMAESAFGDNTVFLERLLTAPRHIEIQVFADTHGQTVSLHERECSIQRRHQKIIEEAPSAAIDDDTRLRMGEAAIAAARAVGYVGAGTVEFLYDGGDFYFLEMNTRLQVEHPVTELVTGLDLVRLQLVVAAGGALPTEATTPTRRGHAIEARLYAEDAESGFLPVTGTVTRFSFPDSVRVDSGVETGSEVTVHYDPLLAKVVAWGQTRAEAAGVLSSALDKATIHGLVTNRHLLVSILRHPEFLAGEIDTAFLDRHDPAELGRPPAGPDAEWAAAVAAALVAQDRRRRDAGVLATAPSGWRNVPSQPQQAHYVGRHGPIAVGYRFERGGSLAVDGAATARIVSLTPGRIGLELEGVLGWYDVSVDDAGVWVDGPDGPVHLAEQERFPEAEVAEEPGSLRAPMPGKVIRVAVAEDDEVVEGQELVVMEAMKMEHTLRAPRAGTVTVLRAKEGDQVAADDVLAVVTGP